MKKRCAIDTLPVYDLNSQTVLLFAIRSAINAGKEISGEFNFEKFKTTLVENLSKSFDLTVTKVLQKSFNDIITNNNYTQLQGYNKELSTLFITQGENDEIKEEDTDTSKNIEDLLSNKAEVPFNNIDKEIYKESLGVNLFRVNEFKTDLVRTILLDDIHLVNSNKKLNLKISQYKEGQYANVLAFVKSAYPNTSFAGSIYDASGNFIFDSLKTLQCFKNIIENDDIFLKKIQFQQGLIMRNEAGDTSLLKALNSYVNITYFNQQLKESISDMIGIFAPNQEGFSNTFDRYSLQNGNQLQKNWSDEELVDAFSNIGKLSNLLISVIPYFTSDGKSKHASITPVLYSKAFTNLIDACMESGGILRTYAYDIHKNTKLAISNIFKEIYQNESSVLKKLDQQDQDVLYSVYKHIFDKEGLLDRESKSAIKITKYPVSSCYMGVIDRVVPMNYQQVKYDSFNDSYNLGIRPKYYNSKIQYDTAQDLNMKATDKLQDSIVSFGEGKLRVKINNELQAVFSGELLSNKNNKIVVKYYLNNDDITKNIESKLNNCIEYNNGIYNIYDKECSAIFDFINKTLGLRDNNKFKSYIMQQLKSSNSLSFLGGMMVSSGKLLTANYVYNDFYHNVKDSAAIYTYLGKPVYDITAFINLNSKLYKLEDISFKLVQGQKMLTPVVVQSSVWIENLSNAQTILDEGQAKAVTTDVFGNHQPNYRISCLGSIPWFYFNQCHENQEIQYLQQQLEADRQALLTAKGDLKTNLEERVNKILPNRIQEIARNASKHLLTSQNPESIKQVNISQDVELKGGLKKKIKDMQFSELIYNSIIFNFYGKSESGEGYNIQPVTYSDKTTFYNYLIDPEMKINGKSLKFMTSDDKIQAMMDTIGKMYNNVAMNVINDLMETFKDFEGFPQPTYVEGMPIINMDYINQMDSFLRANISEETLINLSNHSLQLDVHYQRNGETIKLNPVLMYNGFVLYQNKQLLTNKYKQEEQRFIDILNEKNVVFYTKIKGKETEVMQMFTEYMVMYEDTSALDIWAGAYTGESLMDSWIENDHLIISKDGKLNPFLKNYFYTESLLSNNLRIGLMGSEIADPMVVKIEDDILKTFNIQSMEKAEANTQNTSYKRANIIPATLSTVLQEELNGITPDIRVAVIRDLPANVWKFDGFADKAIDSMDGSALILPMESILENGALQDQGVGDDKKSIWHAFHEDTCSACLLKFATFVISNERMRYSELSDTSLYNIFKKMTNEQWKNVDLGSKFLTSPIYYEKFNKYYKIVGLEKDSKGYYTIEAEADRTGKTSGKTFKVYQMFDYDSRHYGIAEDSIDANIESAEKQGFPLHTINSVFELHSALGGIYSHELVNGILRPSESSNFAVTDYMNKVIINGKQPLKESVISYLANNSAVKRGARNINQNTSWGDATPLHYMTLKSYGLGVQMDPDHEKDDAEITQFSQVITALEAGGRLHEQAGEVYRSLGTVAYQFCKTELDAITDGVISENKLSQLYEILGKTVIDNYSKQNDGELGQTIISRVAKEFNLNINHMDDSYKIPFSDSAIYSSVISTYVSLINKQAIKGKYPGLGAILCPGFSYMQLFKIGDQHYFSEDIYALANKALSSEGGFADYAKTFAGKEPASNAEYHKFIVQKYLDYVQDPDIEDELGRGDDFINDHQFYEPSKEVFKPSDTVFIKLISGNDVQKINIALDTIDKYYDFKNLEIEEFLTKYNIPHLENLTKVKYADSVSKSRDLAPATLSWKYNINDEVHYANIFDVDAVKNHGTSDQIQQAFDDIKLHGKFTIGNVTYDIIPGSIKNEEAQAVMSNMYANTFGTEGQTLGQAKSYYNQLERKEIANKKIKVDNGNYYDMVFINNKNRHLYITFNNVAQDPISQFYPKEQSFKYTRRILEKGVINIYATTKEGQLLYKIGYVENTLNKEAKEHLYVHKYTAVTKDAYGKTGVSIIYNVDKSAPNIAELLKKIYYSNSFKNIEFNSKSSNKSFMNAIIPGLNMESTLQLHLNDVNDRIIATNTWDSYEETLNQYYQQFNKELVSSFYKSLYFTAARTPAQALQSFMKMKIIGYTKSTQNRVYVSHFQTYIQGSDYDIDKSYMMGFSFDDNGKYIGWSPLFDYSSLKTLQASENLPFPTGKLVRSDVNGADVSKLLLNINNALNDADRINKYADLLLYINSNKIDSINASPEVVDIINKHQDYVNSISPLLLQKAIKNSISARVQNIVQDIRNMYDAYQPVTADAIHAAVDYKESRTLIALNPITKYIMQEENMIGKNVISVAANGEKVYYTTLYYFNDQLRYHPDNLGNITFASTFNRIQGRSTGDLVSITKTTIGNINFENSKIAKESLQYVKINSKVDQMLSQLLTAATDNAKELLLAKMNAGMNLAGVHVHLMMLGFDINDIISYMTSPAISAIDFLSKANVFDPNLPKSNVNTVIQKLFGMANTMKDGTVLYSGLESLRANLMNKRVQGNYMQQLATKLLLPYVKNQTDVDNIIADLTEFRGLYGKAVETTTLAQTFLKVNQGLPNSSEGILNMLFRIKNAIKTREEYFNIKNLSKFVEQIKENNPTLENVEDTVLKLNAAGIIGNVDMSKWIRNETVNDESYSSLVSQYYNLIKGTWNLFDIIDKVPQYKQMFDIFKTSALIQERFITRDRVVSYISSKMNYLNEDKLKRISSYIDNLLILNWITKQNYNIDLKPGDIKYDTLASQQIVSCEQSLNLNTVENLATFKYYMENTLIPKLQEDPEYQDNKFVQDLKNGYDKYQFKKLDIDMLKVKNNVFNSMKFSDYLKGFEELGNVKIGNMPLTDAFMLYNMIVNKNKYGSDRMTSLFQYYLDQSDGDNVLTSYYQSVGNLDYNNNQDIESLLNNIKFNEKDMQVNIAKTVNSQEFQKEDYIKTLVDGQLTLMRKVGNSYISVGLVVPPVQNEEISMTMLRSKNYLNDFTFGTINLQLNQALVRNLESNDKVMQAFQELTQSGKIIIKRICE